MGTLPSTASRQACVSSRNHSREGGTGWMPSTAVHSGPLGHPLACTSQAHPCLHTHRGLSHQLPRDSQTHTHVHHSVHTTCGTHSSHTHTVPLTLRAHTPRGPTPRLPTLMLRYHRRCPPKTDQAGGMSGGRTHSVITQESKCPVQGLALLTSQCYSPSPGELSQLGRIAWGRPGVSGLGGWARGLQPNCACSASLRGHPGLQASGPKVTASARPQQGIHPACLLGP